MDGSTQTSDILASMMHERPAPSREPAALDATSIMSAKVTKDFGVLGLEIEVESAARAARVAFSCLVRPQVGDLVLVSCGPEGAFVLAVLDRLVPGQATLSLPSGGGLVVEAETIGLSARDALSIEAHSMSARSRKFNVVADSMTFLGRIATWAAEQMRISAKTQETIADTMSSKAIDRVSVVERADVLRAESLTQTIAGVAVTTAPAAVIATTEDLRLDGKRVTVG